jgi:hypothetical protein
VPVACGGEGGKSQLVHAAPSASGER